MEKIYGIAEYEIDSNDFRILKTFKKYPTFEQTYETITRTKYDSNLPYEKLNSYIFDSYMTIEDIQLYLIEEGCYIGNDYSYYILSINLPD